MLNKISIYYLILVFLISASIITSQIDSIYAKDESEVKNSNKEQEDEILIKLLSASVIASVVTGTITLIGVFLKPELDRRFNLRNHYEEPYTKWCIKIHGAIREFSELCYAIDPKLKHDPTTNDTTKDNLAEKILETPTYIISHIWDMHREIEEGYKWIGVIEKKEKHRFSSLRKNKEEKISKITNDLFDNVDIIWHQLEKLERLLLLKQYEPDDRRLVLLLIHGTATETAIVDKIKIEITDNKKFSSKNFDMIMKYLQKNIPKQ